MYSNLHYIFSGPLVDYSVRVSHLDKNGIEEGLMAYLVDLGQEKERLRKTLAKKLKEKHPIHNKLESFTNAKLNEILVNLSLPVPSHRPRKMKAISDYFFREYPDAPMTNLIKVMEEDAYFAELTTGIIFHIFVEGLFKTN